MATATRTVTITVTTQMGDNADARRVLRDVIDDLRDTDWAYFSVGQVTVDVAMRKAAKR